MSEQYGQSDAGDEWATPRYIWEPLSDALGGFDLDPASGAEAEPIADQRYTVEDNGLSQPWFGDVWLNPPYGRSENPEWAEKVSSEAYFRDVDSITALVPASTDTQWFQENYAGCDYLTLVSGRVTFSGAEKPCTFPSAIVTFGEVPNGYVEALRSLGSVYERVER